jgi:hypothetical protein
MNATGGADDTGRGRLFVDLVTGIERSMCTAIHTLPAVDHLAAPPAPPDADAWRALEEHLAAGGAHGVVASLRGGGTLDGEFRAAPTGSVRSEAQSRNPATSSTCSSGSRRCTAQSRLRAA